MRHALSLALLAALLLPAVAALPAAHPGEQPPSPTVVPAQAGTQFILVGIVGDHHVTFRTSTGTFISTFAAPCANEAGTVPAGAATAHIGVGLRGYVPGTCTPTSPQPATSRFVYIDGI